jgi:hydroxymethylpyrimidine/phosphomethylpyrimidine kinase
VVVTGEVDYITDGQRTRTVTGGDPLMTRVVGTGCALSAVVAASCSLPGDRLDNVAAACGWMKRPERWPLRSLAARQFCQRVPRCALHAGGAGMKRINALTIAGTDPSGGAGIQADLKTFSALGAYGCSVITALVAQNARRAVGLPYRAGFCCRAAGFGVQRRAHRYHQNRHAGGNGYCEAVAERLKRYQVQNVVLDTVMLAKSGDPLLSASAVETLRKKLLPQVALITPNLPEAAALLGAARAN